MLWCAASQPVCVKGVLRIFTLSELPVPFYYLNSLKFDTDFVCMCVCFSAKSLSSMTITCFLLIDGIFWCIFMYNEVLGS
jgi:hypothetical protein